MTCNTMPLGWFFSWLDRTSPENPHLRRYNSGRPWLWRVGSKVASPMRFLVERCVFFVGNIWRFWSMWGGIFGVIFLLFNSWCSAVSRLGYELWTKCRFETREWLYPWRPDFQVDDFKDFCLSKSLNGHFLHLSLGVGGRWLAIEWKWAEFFSCFAHVLSPYFREGMFAGFQKLFCSNSNTHW